MITDAIDVVSKWPGRPARDSRRRHRRLSAGCVGWGPAGVSAGLMAACSPGWTVPADL